jgi:hypothetical protein
MYGAFHETGHITVAAVRGLTLRPDGLMVLSNGDGLCVYCTQPDESDSSRVSVIVSSFAGYFAAKRFCQKYSRPDLLDPLREISDDWKHAREVIAKLSDEYLAGDSPMAVLLRLQKESERLVEQHWVAIEALAKALLAKDPEPMRPLKTGEIWSDETGPVRYMDGEETVEILAKHGIAATCKSRMIGSA